MSGRSKKRKQAEARAEDAAREAERAAAPTPQEQQREKTVFEEEQLLRPLLERRATLGPEALLRETGPITGQLMDLITRRLGQSGEELFGGGGPISQRTLEIARGAVEKPEDFFYADVFNPQLQLVQEAVNQQSARRGLVPQSGLALEKFGRAGIDLAIQNALQRQQARVLGLQTGFGVADTARLLEQQARAEAGGVSDVARSEAGGARNELTNFLNRLQQLREAERERALQGTQARTGLQQNIHLATAEGLRGPSPIVSGLGQLGGAFLGSILSPIGASLGQKIGTSINSNYSPSYLDVLSQNQRQAYSPATSYYSPGGVNDLLTQSRTRLGNTGNYYPYGY